jgi:hypothetical protein
MGFRFLQISMSKDAYYFPHDSNAKDDPKCIMLIEELGVEGYGIFWVLIETLRDQPGYKADIRILPAIARRYNTTTEKVKAVVTRYGLFEVEDDQFFYSNSLIKRMRPLEDKREQARLAGIRSGEIRRLKAKNERAFNGCSTDAEPVNKSKVKESKEEHTNYGLYLDHWNETNNCNLRITEKKRTQIRARLRTFTQEEILQSIVNRSRDDWMNGDGSKFKTDWDSFWRNDDKVERYLHKKQQRINAGVW